MKNKKDKNANSVKQSMDYEKFVLCEGQRKTVRAHVNDLAREMEKNREALFSTFELRPAICRPITDTRGSIVCYKIIDGAHRHQAAKKTRLPFYFLEVSKFDTRSDQELMLTFNAKTKPQTLASQVRTKASEGHAPSLAILELEKRLEDEFGKAPDIGWITNLFITFQDSGGAKKRFEDAKGEIKLNHFEKCKNFLNDIGRLKLNFNKLEKIPKSLNFDTNVLKVCLEMARNYPTQWSSFKLKRTKNPLIFKKNCDLKHFLRSKILGLSI